MAKSHPVGGILRFLALAAAILVAALGTRPAAATVREQAGVTSSAPLACYMGALAAVFDGATVCP